MGGPLQYLPELRKRFYETLELDEEHIIVPDNAHLFVASGCALAGSGAKAELLSDVVSRLENLGDVQGSEVVRLPPLFADDEAYAEFKARHDGERVKRTDLSAYEGAAYLGIDAGSTTFKSALIAEDGSLLWSSYVNNKGDVLGCAKRAVADLYAQLPVDAAGNPKVHIGHATVTGYGEALLLEALRVALILLSPFMPESCDKAFAQIGADEAAMSWEAAEKYGVLPAAVSVTKGENLFPRIDMEKELAALEALKAPKEDPIEPFKPNVVFDDFEKCDFRVCRVLKCEAVKKSQKLLRFELDDGSGTTRQILSGIAMHYKPEELVGKTVAAIVNLPPRKMMGLESCGMLLSAMRMVNGKEELHLVMLDDSIPTGSVLC